MKVRNSVATLVLVAATAGLAASASAQQAGENEYLQACAACHGESGKGMGPIAPLLNIEVPSLTTLAKNNDGVFPMLQVIHIIDGRSGVRGHGGIMPIWGDRFKSAMIESAGEYGAELLVRGRILALAQYLESIQE